MSGGAVYRRGDVLVPLDRNPLEVFLLGLCVVSGLGSLVNPPLSSGVPGWLAAGWYFLLVLGGLAGLTGAYWRDAITGVLIVRAGMIPVGAGAYAYATVTMAHRDVLAGLILFAFGACAHWRAVQITHHVRGQR